MKVSREFFLSIIWDEAVDFELNHDHTARSVTTASRMLNNIGVEEHVRDEVVALLDGQPDVQEVEIEVIPMPFPVDGFLGHHHAGFVVWWDQIEVDSPAVFVFPNN